VITPSADCLAQLVRIKQAVQVASSFASGTVASSRIVATILLDYAAEAALKTVFSTHPSTATKFKEITFPDLLKSVTGLATTPGPFPLHTEISNLHAQRNFTQHRNLIPSSEDAVKNAAYVEAFLRHLYAEFFGLDFHALSMTTLITTTELKTHMEIAEAHLKEGRHQEAVEESALALEKAVRWAAKAVGVRSDPFFSPFFVATDAKRAGFTGEQARVLEKIVKNINKLALEVQDQLRVIAIGMDYPAHARYSSLAPRIYGTLDGSTHFAHRRDSYSDSDAGAVFNYAVNHILRLESVGALVREESESVD
jgi:hypothetical protein